MAVAAVASVAVAATDDVHAALAVASLAAGHQLVSVFEDLQCSTRFIYDTIGRRCERGCGPKGNGAETHTHERTHTHRDNAQHESLAGCFLTVL